MEHAGVQVEPVQAGNLNHSGARWASWKAWAWFIGTMAMAAPVLFYRLGALPIEVWDEARIANNALEMAHTGLSLVTTYGGVPDHWNTKPPLFIWMMTASIRTFGANEWGVRLPSALSALATAAVVFAFCNFRLKRPFAGFSAIVLLFAAGTFGKGNIRCLGNDYIQFHAARDGDYDATLALWTTSFVLAAYMYIHAAQSKQRLWLLLGTIGISLAFLTKTIQGLIFLPALLIYAASQGSLVQILRSPAVYASCAAVLAICSGYYFAREQLDPGYFAAAMHWDVLGRYFIDASDKGPLYYVGFFPCMALLIVGFQLWWGRGESRQISLFLGVVSLFYLVIISSSVNKQSWYAIPFLPLVAMIIAIGVDDFLEWIKECGREFRTAINSMLVPVCMLAGLGVIAGNFRLLEDREAWMIGDERNLTNVFLRSQSVQLKNPQKFVVFQQSYVPGGVPGDFYYVAPTLFYVNAMRAAGYQIEILPPAAVIPRGFNTAVICGATMRETVAAQVALRSIAMDGECGIYQLAAK